MNLTAEWKTYRWSPLISEAAVSSLIDEDGFMWSGVSQVAEKGEPAALKKELECQVETALVWGLKPTHLDTHIGTLYASSTLFNIYIEVAKKYRIPPMVVRPTPENRPPTLFPQPQPESTHTIYAPVYNHTKPLAQKSAC